MSAFGTWYCLRSIRLTAPQILRDFKPLPGEQAREGPLTNAEQALLFAGGFFCLLGAVIATLYFADRVRSDFLPGLNGLFEHTRLRRGP